MKCFSARLLVSSHPITTTQPPATSALPLFCAPLYFITSPSLFPNASSSPSPLLQPLSLRCSSPRSLTSFSSHSSLFPSLFCLPQSLKNTLLVAAGSRRRSSDRTENTVWSTARPAYKSPIEERKAVEERQCTDQEPVDKSKKWYRWEPKPGLYSAKETP